jgi:imidazolonepropionase
MFRHGSTTIEVKTGYGLDNENELKMLQAILELDSEGPWELVPTYLGAHAISPEFKGDPDGYTQHLIEIMLPSLRSWWDHHAPDRPLPFVDVFCETGAFSLDQSRLILEKAQDLGFPLKIHADEFDNLGGVALAHELGAISADHLVVTSQEEIIGFGQHSTVAVALPGTPFGLAEAHYTPARDIIQAGGCLAIASDLNPGTSWCENMQMIITLACRYMKLAPAQAIAAATINSAAAVGRDDRVGSIQPGKQADLVILDEPDYRHLGYRYGTNLVHTVIKNGKVYRVKTNEN